MIWILSWMYLPKTMQWNQDSVIEIILYTVIISITLEAEAFSPQKADTAGRK